MLGIFALTTPGPDRLDALHGQPRLLDRRAVPASPGFLIAPPRLAADRRLRRRAAGRAGAGRASFLLAGLSSLALPGPVPASSREFLVLVGTFARYPVGRA